MLRRIELNNKKSSNSNSIPKTDLCRFIAAKEVCPFKNCLFSHGVDDAMISLSNHEPIKINSLMIPLPNHNTTKTNHVTIQLSNCEIIMTDGGDITTILPPICCRSFSILNTEFDLNRIFTNYRIQDDKLIFNSYDEMSSVMTILEKSTVCTINNKLNCTEGHNEHYKIEINDSSCSIKMKKMIHYTKLDNINKLTINEIMNLAIKIKLLYPNVTLNYDVNNVYSFNYSNSDQQKKIIKILKYNFDGIKIYLEKSLLVNYSNSEKQKKIIETLKYNFDGFTKYMEKSLISNVMYMESIVLQNPYSNIEFNYDHIRVYPDKVKVTWEKFVLPHYKLEVRTYPLLSQDDRKRFFEHFNELKLLNVSYDFVFYNNRRVNIIIKGSEDWVNFVYHKIKVIILNVSNDSIILNQSTCSFCFKEITDTDDKITLTNCGCVFCKECINYIFVVYGNIKNNYRCLCCTILSVNDIIKYSDPKKYLQSYLYFYQNNGNNNNKYKKCLTTDCEGFYFSHEKLFKCHLCQVLYCIECQMEYHNDKHAQFHQDK
jgi:hypothetical protein